MSATVQQKQNAEVPEGILQFLQKHCPQPERLKEEFRRLPARQIPLTDKKVLCREGDVAHEVWIILRGEIVVERDGIRVTERQVGDLVGEMSFYQPVGKQVRIATMCAAGDTAVAKIDKAHIEKWDAATQSLWHETIARVLTEKLAEATDRRMELHNDRESLTGLVGRLVCTEGQGAAMASLENHDIAHEQCDVVMWFSDIKGFSQYAENLSASDSGRLVREIMTAQAEVIEAHGGSIDKFMGDGLMAYWRAPDQERLKEYSRSAVGAALAVTHMLLELFTKRALPLDIRVGVHCGPAVLGDFGGGSRIAFTSIGKTVNSASRYEQARADINGVDLGRLRISDALYSRLAEDALQDRFDVQPRVFKDKNDVEYYVHALKE